MDASDFFNMKVRKAKIFGFPEPVFINAEKLTSRTRVIYTVEIQAMHIPDESKQSVHHYQLKFSKFKKTSEELGWTEEDVSTEEGFTINDKASIEKLAAYIQANQSLLGIDILSKDYTNAFFTNDTATINVLGSMMSSEANKEVVAGFLSQNYPELEKKILTSQLVQARRKALEEFKSSLEDPEKKEVNYWQPFLEQNRWMFGLSYLIPLDSTSIDLWNEADYLFKSEDGFVDIVEIKHPHVDFWQRIRS